MIYQHLFDRVKEPETVRAALVGAGDFGTTIAPTEPEESAERLVAFVQRNPPPEYIFRDLFQDQQFEW